MGGTKPGRGIKSTVQRWVSLAMVWSHKVKKRRLEALMSIISLIDLEHNAAPAEFPEQRRSDRLLNQAAELMDQPHGDDAVLALMVAVGLVFSPWSTMRMGNDRPRPRVATGIPKQFYSPHIDRKFPVNSTLLAEQHRNAQRGQTCREPDRAGPLQTATVWPYVVGCSSFPAAWPLTDSLGSTVIIRIPPRRGPI